MDCSASLLLGALGRPGDGAAEENAESLTASATPAPGSNETAEPGCAALTDLSLRCWLYTDDGAAAALGRSLRRGARLEAFNLEGCDEGGRPFAVEIGDGLAAAGAGARLRELRLDNCHIHDEGA